MSGQRGLLIKVGSALVQRFSKTACLCLFGLEDGKTDKLENLVCPIKTEGIKLHGNRQSKVVQL